MTRRTLLVLIALLCPLFGCAPKAPPLISDADLSVGVAPFTQPEATADLLAGYITDSAPRVPETVLHQLDNDFADLLAEMTKRDYVGMETARQCMQKQPKNSALTAFDYWLAVGRCMNVDLLMVPQIHAWQDRRDGDPAAVSMDIFLLDVQNRALLARSRYDEKQRALLDNLFDVGKFIERRGRWVGASTLAQEGMFKAIKEFGL